MNQGLFCEVLGETLPGFVRYGVQVADRACRVRKEKTHICGFRIMIVPSPVLVGGNQFNSGKPQFAGVAQLVERRPEEPSVAGSTPAAGTSRPYCFLRE